MPFKAYIVFWDPKEIEIDRARPAGPAKASTPAWKIAAWLDDVHGFVNTLAASGRRAIVVVVPEHGAAWRGDAAQIEFTSFLAVSHVVSRMLARPPYGPPTTPPARHSPIRLRRRERNAAAAR